jgi:hypothetical protein
MHIVLCSGSGLLTSGLFSWMKPARYWFDAALYPEVQRGASLRMLRNYGKPFFLTRSIRVTWHGGYYNLLVEAPINNTDLLGTYSCE